MARTADNFKCQLSTINVGSLKPEGYLLVFIRFNRLVIRHWRNIDYRNLEGDRC